MSDAAQIKILVNDHTSHSGSSKVSCSLCKKLFKNIESLKTHQRRIHKDGRSPKRKSKKFLEHLRDVVCPHCESRFHVGRDLFFHLKVVHCLSDEEIQKDFHVPICYICQQAFATYGLQQMHKKIDHLLGKWKCSICLKDFRHGGEVQEHYQGNHQPEEFHIKCALCQAELCFTTGFDVVKEHWDHCLKAKLTEDRLKNAPKYLAKRYVCDECGRAFQSQRLLNDHQDEHRGILKHSCSNCDYKTGTIRKLRSHMHYWHSGKPGYKPPLVACEICGQQVYKTNLWKHVANRHEKKAFSCDKCDKKFGTDLSLRAHKETVHPENTITCNICGIQVKHMAKLKVHMASHQPPKYFCRFCPKALKTTVSLANHERIHTGENPYNEDLQLLDFDPWIVITRQTLDFDTKGNKPFISMMMFLDTKSRVFILSVVYRTYKEGPIQNLEQVNQLIHEFFEDRHPCWGYGSDEDLPRPYSHQYATKCTVLVAKQGDQCGWCYEKYLSIESNDDSGTNMDSILEDLVENAMDSKPLFEVRDRGSDQGNCGKEISMEEPLGGSEYCPIVDDMENTIDNTDKLDALENKPDQEDQAAHNYNRTLIPCPLCEKSFKSSYSLRAHHRRSHQCENSNPFKSALSDHQDEHQGILKHECSKCDYKTGTASKLTAHRKYWHSARARKFQKKTLVSCEICGTQVEQSYLSRHIANNHETPAWPCNECEKRFGTEITLKRHKSTVHSKTMVDCQVCGVQVKCAEKLKVHMAIHLPPKYFCRFCGKGLKSTVSLGNHERKVHTGENPYRCETCPFACASSGELLLHKKRQHNVPKVHFYKYMKNASSK
ncbi:hypothetical protein TCAL_01253 [Tigriopus californicus]|uniref:C2H2-type domain-containing protein n=1 Tax=Tigriopus californicus TaxID=6832 RepID=A0A553P073_TIGCA|nr:hypothetical protein TCAL_01253 [Tigriopus californicus]